MLIIMKMILPLLIVYILDLSGTDHSMEKR
jgi:hypothetical protein